MNLVPKYNTIVVDKLGLKLFDRLCSPTGITLFFCRYLEEQESCHKGQSHRIGLRVFSASTSVTSPSSRVATISSSVNIQVLLLMGLLSRNWSRRFNFCFFSPSSASNNASDASFMPNQLYVCCCCFSLRKEFSR